MPDPRFLRREFVDSLDDHAFVVVKEGGARDAAGKTSPRRLRLGPHHEPSERRIGLDARADRGRVSARRAGRSTGDLNEAQVKSVIAQLNAGSLPLSLEERRAAWEHMRQHARELDIPMPPRRF